MVPGVSMETSPTASYRRSTSVPCLCFTDERAPLTAGPIYQSVYWFDFLIFLTDLNTHFKNSYLELGMSKLSELNLIGFLMKCTI